MDRILLYIIDCIVTSVSTALDAIMLHRLPCIQRIEVYRGLKLNIQNSTSLCFSPCKNMSFQR